MEVPTAHVKVEILTIKNIPPTTLKPGDTRYARAYFQVVYEWGTGRSRPIPDTGGDFDVTNEAEPWVFEANVYSGSTLYIKVEIDEDRGDVPPPPPVVMTPQYGFIQDPWTSGVRLLGSVEVRVTTVLVSPLDHGVLARSTDAEKPSGVVTVPQGYFVEIIDIWGLYQPPGPYRPGFQLDPEYYVVNLKNIIDTGSKRVPGYVSADNLGRIFTNRLPDGTWHSGTQYIEVIAKVRAFGGLAIPAGAQIEWLVEDVDDPTNETRDFHRDAGRYVDANDYDSAGNPIGAHSGDNAAAFSPGNTDEDKLFEESIAQPAEARWAATAGGPVPVSSSRSQATTAIKLADRKNGETSIRIHCTNVLGTNLRVRAELTGIPASEISLNASSGVMTMWSRIDVEVGQMKDARSIEAAVDSVPWSFLPACVQLDIHPARELAGDGIDKSELAKDHGALQDTAWEWTNKPGVFTHARQPGWFFLAAARLPYPPSGGSAGHEPVENKSYTFKVPDLLSTDGDVSWATFVIIKWHGSDGNALSAGFSVAQGNYAPVTSGGTTTLHLLPIAVNPEFAGHNADGNENIGQDGAIYFYPNHQLMKGSHLQPGGFGIPPVGATATFYGAGKTLTSGLSPTVTPNPADPKVTYFAGRTLVFTEAIKDPNDFSKPLGEVAFTKFCLSFIAHELVHAFGLPHICGNWDWRTAIPRQSCCMNYPTTWLLDHDKHPIPGSAGKVGTQLCGKHLMELRRVHIEKNKGLNW